MRQLFGMYYSPWTEKARWALDHHKLEYDYREHLLIFGMPELRFKMRTLSGDLTVPALIDGKNRISDSLKIAKYTDTVGTGEKLFPKESLDTIEAIDAASERALCAARAWVMHRTAKNPQAQLESLPKFIPSALRKPSRGLVAVGLAYLDREFRVSDQSLDHYTAEMKRSFDFFRETLKKSGGKYVLGSRFSFGDIALAAGLQALKPVSDGFMKLPPAVRDVWTSNDLVTTYGDLIKWRDEIYRDHRGASSSSH